MKTITRMVMTLVATGTMALFATTASAVEPRLNATPNTSAAITGKSFAPSQLLVEKAPSTKKIVVAGRRGRAIGLGILAGVGTAILLSKAARANGRHHHYHSNYRHRSRHNRRCAKWEYKCHEYGHRRACRKFYNRCGY